MADNQKLESDKHSQANLIEDAGLDTIYDSTNYWHVNLGEKRIHAKRLPGKFRRIKWAVASLYLSFFLLPYLRWGERQAILLDIPERKYHFFGITAWPDDIWILAMFLLTFFIFLYASTALAGRVFCGYICWQTVWVDVYTWIEEKIEGSPKERMELDAANWSLNKIFKKVIKTIIFLSLSALTGITFTAYFIDVYDLWHRLFTFQGPIYIWTVPMVFLIGSYIGVAIMREQICFWLCPYARIQGVMTDDQTYLPTYDFKRGEQRAKIASKKDLKDQSTGDCVDCNLCVVVCPTGVDIRNGQQEGCITCGLCIDACDMVMDKIKRPRGLIRYISLVEQRDSKKMKFWQRPRVILYLLLLSLTTFGIVYGISNMREVVFSVIKDREPLYIMLSDGSIKNRYNFKLSNKREDDIRVHLKVDGVEHLLLELENNSGDNVVLLPHSKVSQIRGSVSLPKGRYNKGNSEIRFIVEDLSTNKVYGEQKSSFVAP